MSLIRKVCFFTGLAMSALVYSNAGAETVRVGSKNFNESYILAEIMAQVLEGAGYDVEWVVWAILSL